MDLGALMASVETLWLLWLVVLFVAIVGWAYWPSRKARFERDGRIPFDDDTV